MKDPIGPVSLDSLHHRRRVAEVDLDHLYTIPDAIEIRIGGRASRPFDAEHLNTGRDEMLRKIGSVLSADSRDECLRASHPAIVPSRTQYACVNVE